MKNFGFIELNDGSCFKSLQVVMDRNLLDNYDEIAKRNVGAALICHGTLAIPPDAPQPFGLKADGIAVEGVHPDYPCRKAPQRGYLRTISICAPARICFPPIPREKRGRIRRAEFFQNRGFVYVHTPSSPAPTAGRGEMFRVTTLDPENPPPYRDGKSIIPRTFSAGHQSHRSGQLNAENFAMAFGDVYTFGPHLPG